jgi:hypothetical protein
MGDIEASCQTLPYPSVLQGERQGKPMNIQTYTKKETSETLEAKAAATSVSLKNGAGFVTAVFTSERASAFLTMSVEEALGFANELIVAAHERLTEENKEHDK